MKTILAVALLVSAASPLFAQCTDADRKKLEALDHAWSDATNAGDRAALQKIVADDFTGISASGYTTKAELIDNAVRNAERAKASVRPAPKVTYDQYLIACTPVSATITHRTAVPDDTGKVAYSRSVHVLEKRGDGWQVVSNAGHALTDSNLLLYLEREWNDAEMKRDAAWFERTLADDYTGVDSRTGARTTKIEQIADIKKNTVESAVLSEMDVRMEGDTAVVTGVTHNKGKDDKGAASDSRIRFTDVWIKRGGRWLVLSSHGSETK